MKSEILEPDDGWTPVEVKLTFSTKGELAAFLLLTNDTSAMEDLISNELQSNAEFNDYDVDANIAYSICPHGMWCRLKEKLEE